MNNTKLLSTSNTIKSVNAATFSLYKGKISSNLTEEIEYEREAIECLTNSIDFSCPDNSQYISSI